MDDLEKLASVDGNAITRRPTSSLEGNIMRTPLGLALIIAGSGGAFLALMATRRVLQQDRWRKVQGTVVDGRIDWTSETFAARIAYEYIVDGSTLTGDVVRSAAVEFNWRGPAEKILARYPPGSEVTVFVNPSNSGNAVLEPGGSNAYPFAVALSVIAFVAGFAVLLTGLF
jgi:Protein of unknown function (DUF3592)